MPTIRLALVMLAAGAAVVSAQAEERIDCVNAMTQAEMTYCAAVEYEDADAELNRIWPKAVAVAKDHDRHIADMLKGTGAPTTLEALRDAQRAWIKFRDAQCAFEAYEVFGGTAQPMFGTLCLARLTRERTEFLSHVLEPL